MSPQTLLQASVVVMLLSLAPRQTTLDSLLLSAIASAGESETVTARTQRLVIDLFRSEARSLVRLARLFVDDRDAAEDIVQEAFCALPGRPREFRMSRRLPLIFDRSC